MTCKLNFLSAKKTPKVKWHKIIKADIAADTPRPCEPYANKQIGKPILPVFGKINGGSSVITSLFKNFRKIIPITLNPVMAIKEYQKYSINIAKVIPVVVIE